MSKVHRFPLRIYIEDTDAGGIVYFANYLKFSERARTNFLHELGGSHRKMMKEQGIIFVVRSSVLNCLAPATLDDVLEVQTTLKKLGHAKLEFGQAILREEKVIATVDTVVACMNSSGKPVKLDNSLRQMLTTYQEDMERKG